MSLRRAAAAFDSVVRRIKFSEQHPHVHIQHKSVPEWHWEASWMRGDGTASHKVEYDLGILLDRLEEIDWAGENPQDVSA